MKSLVYSLAGLLLCQMVYAQDDDFWLTLDDEPARSGLLVNAGSDLDGARYYGVSLSQAVDAAQLYVSGNKQRYAVTTSDWSVGVGSNPFNDFSVRVDVAWSGKTEVLETRDNIIESTTRYNSWLFLLGYQYGEAEIFLPRSQLIQRRSFEVDRTAWHTGLGYSWMLVSMRLEHRQFDYAENIRIAENITSLRNLIRTFVLNQAEALADKQTSVSIDVIKNNIGVDARFSRITSAIDLKSSDYATVEATYYFDADYSLAVQWDKALESDTATVGVNVGWQW
ncbi:MAG: hypothetical protein HYZ31_06310 [Gammaproteobacteria bacterium]|jgi:hypothetical protein|nr:hypothetical protein [Gammaproteobacteria bacterium]